MPIYPQAKTIKIDITWQSIWHTDIADLFSRPRSRKAPARDLALFCRKMTFLLDAGLTIRDAMPILSKQSSGKVLPGAILNVHKQVMQGESLSRAMEEVAVFPAFLCKYIAVGEQAGKLPQIFAQLADYYDSHAQTKSELVAAMMYPLIVTVMMLGVIVLAMTLVLPGYARIFAASGVELPVLTRALMNISGFLMHNTILILAGIVLAATAIVYAKQTQCGQDILGNLYLKIPLLRLSVNFHLAQALALILSAGVNVSSATVLCVDVMGNPKVKKDLQRLFVGINIGESFWESLGQMQYIDPLFINLAQVGEESGNLPQAMERCCSYFSESYRHDIRRLNKLIEPIITLVMGLLLAFVMLAVVLPTFELAAVM